MSTIRKKVSVPAWGFVFVIIISVDTGMEEYKHKVSVPAWGFVFVIIKAVEEASKMV